MYTRKLISVRVALSRGLKGQENKAAGGGEVKAGILRQSQDQGQDISGRRGGGMLARRRNGGNMAGPGQGGK